VCSPKIPEEDRIYLKPLRKVHEKKRESETKKGEAAGIKK
jgi:hypothetical protein